MAFPYLAAERIRVRHALARTRPPGSGPGQALTFSARSKTVRVPNNAMHAYLTDSVVGKVSFAGTSTA
jgi:hypothetical protein